MRWIRIPGLWLSTMINKKLNQVSRYNTLTISTSVQHKSTKLSINIFIFFLPVWLCLKILMVDIFIIRRKCFILTNKDIFIIRKLLNMIWFSTESAINSTILRYSRFIYNKSKSQKSRNLTYTNLIYLKRGFYQRPRI